MRVEFKESEFIVRRRYNDFVWLRQKLVEAFPTHLVPVSLVIPFPLNFCIVFYFFILLTNFYNICLYFQPLPGKHTLLAQLDRYSKSFVLARLAMLHRFLTRVVSHPVLSYNSSLYVFLTVSPSVSYLILGLMLLIT